MEAQPENLVTFGSGRKAQKGSIYRDQLRSEIPVYLVNFIGMDSGHVSCSNNSLLTSIWLRFTNLSIASKYLSAVSYELPVDICYVGVSGALCISQFQAPTSPRGNFLKGSKTLPRGKIFLQKHGPRDKKIPTPGEYCESLVSFSCWSALKFWNFGILQKSNLKKNWKAVQVISFSFSLSTILKVLKFSRSFQTDFVTREQQRDGTSV